MGWEFPLPSRGRHERESPIGREYMDQLTARRQKPGGGRDFVEQRDAPRARNEDNVAAEIETFAKLTPRLQEILRLIADGLSTKEIAAQLNITKKTVEFHRGRLAKQLGIHPIALLARYAVRMGVTSP
jgi:DNA-binding NarL/FixJ family response regulator